MWSVGGTRRAQKRLDLYISNNGGINLMLVFTASLNAMER